MDGGMQHPRDAEPADQLCHRTRGSAQSGIRPTSFATSYARARRVDALPPDRQGAVLQQHHPVEAIGIASSNVHWRNNLVLGAERAAGGVRHYDEHQLQLPSDYNGSVERR
jgi:hypothetical protein